MTFNPYINEYSRIQNITTELKDIIAREDEKRPLKKMHLSLFSYEHLEEVIEILEEIIMDGGGYDSDGGDYYGEPPITANEMHTAAWKQHVEMHS